MFVEATGVEARGRISPGDMGLWNDDAGAGPWRASPTSSKSNGAPRRIQLAHAGRKGSTRRPWDGGAELTPPDAAKGEAAWEISAPSALKFAETYPDAQAYDPGRHGRGHRRVPRGHPPRL